MRAWDVPGIAVSIVKDDEIVLARGFGVRQLGESEPVDEATLFAIGSCSKAFTAAALAMLVDEGKLDWGDRVTKHLEGFQLYDPYVTREITVRDLLCHRSGLGRGDAIWYATSLNRDQVLYQVRFLKPSWGFRERYGYQNIMFLAAGQIVPSVTGKSWDEFIQERFFAPLGMKTSTTSVVTLAGRRNVARPHGYIERKIQPIPYRNLQNIAPAGSINSSVVEMAQWVRLQLGRGEYEGERLIEEASIREMRRAHTAIPVTEESEKRSPSTHFAAYGLGWSMRDYHGRKVLSHGGGIDGMTALVGFIPEENLGVVILANMNGTALNGALANRIYDAYLGAPERDWSAELLKEAKTARMQARSRRRNVEKDLERKSRPPFEAERYAGRYVSDLYGEIVVAAQEGGLGYSRGAQLTGDLRHRHLQTFHVLYHDVHMGGLQITFGLNADGEIDRATVTGLGDFMRVDEGDEEVEDEQ